MVWMVGIRAPRGFNRYIPFYGEDRVGHPGTPKWMSLGSFWKHALLPPARCSVIGAFSIDVQRERWRITGGFAESVDRWWPHCTMLSGASGRVGYWVRILCSSFPNDPKKIPEEKTEPFFVSRVGDRFSRWVVIKMVKHGDLDRKSAHVLEPWGVGNLGQ